MSSIPKELPASLEAYGRSPDFTPDNLPARLQAAHATKAGTWGLLHVLEGKILYQLEAPFEGEQSAAAGERIVIESEVPHKIVEGGRFFVEFTEGPNSPADEYAE
jgi:tellurite resistance-related uncharacterized protein